MELRGDWLIFGRFLVTVGLLLTVAVFNLLYPGALDYSTVYRVIALILSLSVLYFLLKQSTKVSRDFLIKFQLIVDVLLICALIYVTGVHESPFLILFFLPILLSALLLNKKNTLLFGVYTFLSLLGTVAFYHLLTPPGSLFSLLNRMVIYAFSFGGVSLLATYLSERVRRQQEEFSSLSLLMQAVMENVDYAFVTVDPEKGSVVFQNRRARELFPSSNQFFDFFETLSLPLSQEERSREWEKEMGDRVFSVQVQRLDFQTRALLLFLLRDRTWEKRREREARRREKLASLGEIAAGMAHEIRNPLTSVMASLQLLSEAPARQEDHLKLLSIIVEDFRRLSSVIEDFLIFTENRTFQVVEFDGNIVYKQVLKELERDGYDLTKIKNVSPEEPISFKGNAYHFSILVKNLLTNSIKAVTNSSGYVKVEIRQYGEELRIVVEDTGVGMETKTLNQIFDPFYSNFRQGGMGVGLSIVKRIVDLYDGTLDVESEPGEGSRFSVTLHSLQTPTEDR